MNTPVLETNRLLLRPFTNGDAHNVFNTWERDSEVSKYMFWESHNDINKSISWVEEEISKIGSDNWYRWAVILKKTEELIGTCIIYLEEEHGKYEVAYNLGKQFWGNGYTTEALAKVIEFSKDVLGIDAIIGRYAEDNFASGRVLEKLGFQFVKNIPYKCNSGEKSYQGKEYILKL